MRLLVALKQLQEVGVPVMETRDIAIKLALSNAHASKILTRLAQEKHIISLTKGLWAINPQINPLQIPGYLLAPYACYISLQTALYHYGMIDQIPRKITVVSLSRTRIIKTAIAVISVHHVNPDFFFGFEMDAQQIKIATPEKALLDIFYLKPAKSLWFQSLPELEIPQSFDVEKIFEMARKIPFKARRSMVEEQLHSIF